MKWNAACLLLLSIAAGGLCLADERRAIPEPPLEKEAEKKVRATFQNDYANAKPEARRALARKLLDQGQAQAVDSALRYVLWRGARDLAASAGAWVGGKSNRPEIRLGGIGEPVTGITGKAGDALDSLGLLLGF